jgi:predicted MFS family arabinose efflux permease
LLLISLISLTIFVYIEKRAENAILPLFLFQNKVFLIANMINFILIFGQFGAILFSPFFVQGVLGETATASSYVMLPMPIGIVTASITTGQILSRTGRYKPLAIFGLSLMTCVIFSLTLIDSQTSLISLAFRMFLLGMGLGTSFPVFTLSVQNAVEYRHLGVATSSVQLFRQLGGTIGISLGGSIFSLTLAKFLPASALAHHSALTIDLSSFAADQHAKIQQALTHAITNVFTAEVIALALAVILAVFLKEIPLRTTNRNKSDWKTDSSPPVQHAK